MDAAVPQPIDSQLNPRQTFANFIEGDSNKLPRSVGMSIAKQPHSSQFNPMFVYGPSGCGKTHLINAIGMQIKSLFPQMRVLYVSARLFQVQYTDSVRQNTVNDFINFYQTIDVLIVDDVQEWIGSAKTQQTFFHIFDHLFRNGRRIVLASDRPPVDLMGMPERLLTRFACGLIAELEKPNMQLCVDILNNIIRRDGLQIPADVVQYIADTTNGSVRDLEDIRIQGTYLDDNEVEKVVECVKQYGEPDYIDDQIFVEDEEDEEGNVDLFGNNMDEDPLYDQALEIVVQSGKASASYIQRRLKIGYNRAARLVEEMEERGIVGPANGSKPREIIHIPG